VFAWVLGSLDQLVLKPVDGAGGAGIVIGPHASGEELADLKAKVVADPRGWMAQRPVALSTSPVLVGEKLAPRHIDLRPFAVNDGSDVWVLPGGLTRVALPEGELKVNSSQGGGSKDTWVLAASRPGKAAARQRQDQGQDQGQEQGQDQGQGQWQRQQATAMPAPGYGPQLTAIGRQSGPDQ